MSTREQEAFRVSVEQANHVLNHCPEPITCLLTAALVILSVERHMGEDETQRVLQEVLRKERAARRSAAGE